MPDHAPALGRTRTPFVARYYILAVIIGWGIEGLYGYVAESDLKLSIRTFCLLWFASGAAFFAGTIGGFLFGVPKVESKPDQANPVNSSRYRANTNLEDISDWLTKIILGLSLVHVDKILGFVDSIGQEVATAIGPAQGSKVIAISSMIYGFVCGFITIYAWTNTALRNYLERSGS